MFSFLFPAEGRWKDPEMLAP